MPIVRSFMKKIFIIVFVFIAMVPTLSTARTWWETTSYSDDYYDSIDFGAIKRIIEQEMDRLFQPHAQTIVNRNYLNEVKEYAKTEIAKIIKNNSSTHAQAKKHAIRLTEEFAVDIVVDWAAYIARELLQNPPVNPAYINKQEIIGAIKQIIRSQAHLALKEKDRRLTKIVQNLVENVEILIAQEINYALAW